jgi:hypothetical protein
MFRIILNFAFFVRRRHFEALFIRNIYNGFITCPSLWKPLVSEFQSETLENLISFVLLLCDICHWALAANDNLFFNINFLLLLLIGSYHFVIFGVVMYCICYAVL